MKIMKEFNLKKMLVRFYRNNFIEEFNGSKILAAIFLIGVIVWYIVSNYYTDIFVNAFLKITGKLENFDVREYKIVGYFDVYVWRLVAINVFLVVLYVNIKNVSIFRRIAIEDTRNSIEGQYRQLKIKKITLVKYCIFYWVFSGVLIVFISKIFGPNPLLYIAKLSSYSSLFGIAVYAIFSIYLMYYSAKSFIVTGNLLAKYPDKIKNLMSFKYPDKIKNLMSFLKIPIINPFFVIIFTLLLSAFYSFYLYPTTQPFPLSDNPLYPNCIDAEHRYEYLCGYSGYGVYIDQRSGRLYDNTEKHKSWSHDIVVIDTKKENAIVERKTLLFEIYGRDTYVKYKNVLRRIDLKNTAKYNMVTRKTFLYGYYYVFRYHEEPFVLSDDNIIDF